MQPPYEETPEQIRIRHEKEEAHRQKFAEFKAERTVRIELLREAEMRTVIEEEKVRVLKMDVEDAEREIKRLSDMLAKKQEHYNNLEKCHKRLLVNVSQLLKLIPADDKNKADEIIHYFSLELKQ